MTVSAVFCEFNNKLDSSWGEKLSEVKNLLKTFLGYFTDKSSDFSHHAIPKYLFVLLIDS